MLEHLDEIESDLSVFHRIDDWTQLGSSRYFRLAALLPAYPGAVQAALRAGQAPAPAPDPISRLVAPDPGGEQPRQIDDLRVVERMTKNPGFAGIEYSEG